MSKEIKMSAGQKLVSDLRNHIIIKEYLSNHGRDFHGGYEQLYSDKFKNYLGSVSRHICNKQLKEVSYNE